jgi:hypothetical protein
MNLGLIPIIMTCAVAIICGAGAVIGGLLLIAKESRPMGWQILRCAGISLVTGVFCAWAGFFRVWRSISIQRSRRHPRLLGQRPRGHAVWSSVASRGLAGGTKETRRASK